MAMTRRRWVSWFMGTTIAAIVLVLGAVALELWAALDSDPATVPWTFLTVQNVSPRLAWPVIALVSAGLIWLGVWVPIHFRYWFKHRRDVP